MIKKLGPILLISGLLFSLNSYGYHGKRDGLQGHSKQDIDRYKYIEKERANSKAAIIRRLEAKLEKLEGKKPVRRKAGQNPNR